MNTEGSKIYVLYMVVVYTPGHVSASEGSGIYWQLDKESWFQNLHILPEIFCQALC